MKKALIVIEAFTGYEIGQLVNIGEANEIDHLSGYLYSRMVKVPLAEELENIPFEQLKTNLVEASPLQYSNGVDTVFDYLDIPQIADENSNMISDPSYVLTEAVEEHWEVILDQVAYLTQVITELYSVMTKEVIEEMAIVFGTTSVDSALSYEATWKEMILTPSDYSIAGLSARFDIAGLTTSDALDTDQKITDYATAKIVEVKAYAVWRMQRIEQFRTDRAALGA